MPIRVEQIVERARRILDDAGLVPGEHIDLSGNMALCGTTRRPHGTDGRYKVHMDFPPNVWLINYHDDGVGRSFPLYKQGELDAMPEAERAALRERIRQQKLAAQREREKRQRRAAMVAQKLLPLLPPAGAKNGYLRRKGVRPVDGMRETRAGRLVVPVYIGGEGITSIQRIFENGDKRFLKGGKIEGGFFPVPAENGAEEGPLLIGEGVATVLSACMATGYAGLVAFNAGNLKAVAEAARARHPERTIILLADNDCTFSDGLKREGEANTGVFMAREAAQAIGARLAVCPAIDGRSTDFNDLHQARGLEAVREAVEAAEAQPSQMKKPSYRCLNIAELITKDFPPRNMLLSPVMAVQSLSMIFAMRGVGKTFFALSCAYAVASGGGAFGRWFAPAPAKVLYIDGEMPAVTLQERLKNIALSAESDIVDPDFLRILTPDVQDGPMPNLGTREGQEAVESFLKDVALVVVDNIATLARTGKANDEDSWMPVQEWLLALRRRGISVLLVHHAGKNGSQRGTGAKEDILDTVIQLKRPSDYKAEQGARFEVHFTKARGLYGDDTEPFEAMLSIDEQRQCCWRTKKVEDVVEERILELLEAGYSEREIVEELKDDHVGRTRIRNIKRKFEAEGKSFAKSVGGYQTHKNRG